jgi:O-antigen/teichoic acid export membrane protein
VLALGHYINSALGFNGVTLRVFGKVRYLVSIDFITAVISVMLSLLLIPYYAALGAAIATCGTYIVQNALYQIGLRRGTGITLFGWRYARVYGSIAIAALSMLLIQSILDLPILASITLAGLVSLFVLAFNRRELDVSGTFPELLRFRLARRLFGT